MIKLIFRGIWWVSETFDVPLGNAAPYVFGKSIGRKAHRKSKTTGEGTCPNK